MITNRTIIRGAALGAAVIVSLLAGGSAPAGAQVTLAGHVAGAPEGAVQFSYPARAGVCGDGATFIGIDGSTFEGMIRSIDSVRSSCAAGPVRVVLERGGRDVLAVRTFVGPVAPSATTVMDLGSVPARDAADYLLALAGSSDGRAGRDAILPAVLAADVDVSERLIALARDGDRPLETRRVALSYLRHAGTSPAATGRMAPVLSELAKDASHPQALRRQAMSTLGRLAGGAGVPSVVALARSGTDAWLAQEAVRVLARSGDPRARESLRDFVRRNALPDEPASEAIRGLAGDYATAQDVALVREVYPRLPGERSRRAAITAIADRGGAGSVPWLLRIASDAGEREPLRRAALGGARRAGATSAELARLYDDGDNTMRQLVVTALAEQGDEAAVTKLLAVARSGDDRAVRRRAISALGRIDDPRVKAALGEIVVR